MLFSLQVIRLNYPLGNSEDTCMSLVLCTEKFRCRYDLYGKFNNSLFHAARWILLMLSVMVYEFCSK